MADTVPRYSSIARLLHWLTVAFVVVLVPAGLVMINLDPGPWQDRLYIVHKNGGPLLLVIVLLRLLWRLVSPPPPLPAGLEPYEVTASRVVHVALYAFLVVMAVSGYLRTVAGGFPIELLNAWGVPPLIGKNKPIEDAALWVHRTAIWALLALIALHVGAALRHALIKRDGVMRRMWPPL